MRLKTEELLYHLRLIRSENIGSQRFSALLARFGSAQAALEALQKNDVAWARALGKKPVRLASRESAERELAYAEKIGAHFISLNDSAYPRYLREIDNPPPLIAVKGNIALLQSPAVGIVGSRSASAAGQRLSAMFAYALGQAGYAICSGFARGIDACAHKASLQSGTIAVVAGGADYIYPPEHKGLYQDILAQGGVFVSEMPLAHQPRAMDFPRRNRLIAALSLGLLVVEASERSGSLISARYATEAGRIVFAVPGSPLDPRAKGANGLIKNGACLADCPEDITDILRPLTEPADTDKRQKAAARGYMPANAANKTADSNADLFCSSNSDAEMRHKQQKKPTADTPAGGSAVFPADTGFIAKDVPLSADSKAATEAKSDKTSEDDDLTDAEKQKLKQTLSPAPVTIENLAEAAQIPLSRLYLGLLELELAGDIVRHEGGMVSALPK